MSVSDGDGNTQGLDDVAFDLRARPYVRMPASLDNGKSSQTDREIRPGDSDSLMSVGVNDSRQIFGSLVEITNCSMNSATTLTARSIHTWQTNFGCPLFGSCWIPKRLVKVNVSILTPRRSQDRVTSRHVCPYRAVATLARQEVSQWHTFTRAVVATDGQQKVDVLISAYIPRRFILP